MRWGVCGAAAVLLLLSRKREMPSHCLPPGAYCWAVAPPGGRAPTLTPQRQPGSFEAEPMNFESGMRNGAPRGMVEGPGRALNGVVNARHCN